MSLSRLPVPSGQSLVAWLLSPVAESPFSGRAALAEDRVQYRFINGFVDVGELPCRRAWREEMLGRQVSLQSDFEVSGVYLPGLNRRVEFTGFWHTPTHLARWCRTRLVPPHAGDFAFQLSTCGGVRIWVDGEPIVCFEPYQRNSERSCAMTLPLRAEGSEIVVLCEELAERDTLWYFELRNAGDAPLEAELPLDLSADDLEGLRQLALGVRPERDVFSSTPFTLVFDRPAPRALVVEVNVQRHSHDLSLSGLLSRRLELPAGVGRLEVAAPGEIPDGFHQVSLCFSIGDTRLERRIDAAFLSDVGLPHAAASLAARKREALSHLARHGEHRIGKALAILETGPDEGREAELRALIVSTLNAIDRREDCSDFVMVPLLWIWAAHRDKLESDIAADIRRAVLAWRYWVDEPGNDAMWFWSENHVLCFHVSQLLAGMLFPDEVFVASGRRGAAQARLARERLACWFDAVEAHGLAEWNSAAYYPVDCIGLFALERWAEPELAARARRVLDRLFTMIALHTLGGVPAGSMGRAYDKELKAGPLTELAPFCRVAFGAGWLNSGVASLPMFAAGSYEPPAVAQGLVTPGADTAIGARYVQGYQPARLVLHKTRDVQLSTVVDGEPGRSGHQQHMLDLRFAAHPFARAWINHPGEDDPFGHQRPSYWAGNGRMPRVAQQGDTALMLYELGEAPRLPFTHAYVAHDAFDEVVLRGRWLFLRCGDGYAALGGNAPLDAITTGATAGHEYRVPGARAAWMVRIASGQTPADFLAFQQAMNAVSFTFDSEHMNMQINESGRPAVSLDWQQGLSVAGRSQAFAADSVVPQITVSHDLDRVRERVASGLARLKAINETAPAAEGRFDIQFDEWDWEVGVGLYGLMRQAAATQDQALIDALARWYDWQIGRGLPPRQVNSTAPMLPLVLLIDHVARPDWEALVQDWAQWLMNGLARTEDDGFQHVVKERPNTGELWDDTLFMTCLFLARAGRRFGRQDWVDEAAYQFMLHTRYLADPKTGLWYHGWTFLGRHNFAGAFWARGNAWITAAIPELFDLLGGADQLPREVVRYLTAVLSAQVTALQALQRGDGMFHTLLNDASSPVETSATAGIAYGILRATDTGLLPAPCREAALRGLAAVLQRIDADGIVLEVSDGTAMGHSLDFYRQIPNVPAPYGQALVMLLLGEAIRQQTEGKNINISEAKS